MITLKNKSTNLIETVGSGPNWLMFLFGPLHPLFTGMIGYGLVALLLSLLTGGLALFVLPFVYNKHRAKHFMKLGYLPEDENSKNLLQAMNIGYLKG